ncbi:hypothetical protein EBR43_13610, partial [bacterium]|nr:hypothetical protein [bacterium]
SSAATLLAHKTDEQIKAVLIQEMIEESQSMSSHDEERSDDYSCIYNIISAKNTDEHSAAVLAFLDYLIATGSLNASDVSYENQSILRNTLTKVFEEKIQKYLSLVPTMVDIYLRGESIGFTKDFMEGVLESKMAEIKKLRTPQAFINEKLTLIIQSLKDRFCDSVAKIKLELKEDEYMYQETFKSANVEIVYLYDGVKKGLVINFT